MKKIVISLSLAFAPFLTLLAQNGNISSDKDVTPNTTSVPKKLDIPIEKVSVPASKLTFNETSHDFGNLKQNVPATFEFVFTNNGKDPVIIEDVQRSCGCTTPDWSKEPVLPGKKGKITATYNSASAGNFSKSITVKFADGVTEILTIRGFVEAAPSVPDTPISPSNN